MFIFLFLITCLYFFNHFSIKIDYPDVPCLQFSPDLSFILLSLPFKKAPPFGNLMDLQREAIVLSSSLPSSLLHTSSQPHLLLSITSWMRANSSAATSDISAQLHPKYMQG